MSNKEICSTSDSIKEGAAEWSATGPENQGGIMARGSIPPPSSIFTALRNRYRRWRFRKKPMTPLFTTVHRVHYYTDASTTPTLWIEWIGPAWSGDFEPLLNQWKYTEAIMTGWESNPIYAVYSYETLEKGL